MLLPKQARRVLTIGQRVALNQIKLLVRRHKVTEEEIKRICQEVGGGESAETPQDDGLGTGFEGGDDGAVASKTDAMAAVASEVAPSSEEVIAEAQGSVGATANRETTPEVTKADQPQVLDTSVPGNPRKHSKRHKSQQSRTADHQRGRAILVGSSTGIRTLESRGMGLARSQAGWSRRYCMMGCC